MEIDIIRERSPLPATTGRPEVPLEICSAGRMVGTIAFGAADFRLGLVDPRGSVLAESRESYRASDVESTVARAAEGLARLAERAGSGRRMLGVGATIGGWVDPSTGTLVRFAPRDWYDVKLADILRSRLDTAVMFDQSIRGLALAERMFGVARGADDFVELWVGDVIGAAIVDRGVIRRGPRGGAGQAAHLPVREGAHRMCVCGRRGCVQASASHDALVAMGRERNILDQAAGIDTLVALAHAGRPDATRLIWEAATQLASSFAATVDMLNPSMVVVGGLLTETPQFLEAFRSALIHEADRFIDGRSCVAVSSFGDGGPTIASASLVLDAFYRDPFRIDAAARPATSALFRR
ncbi:ROK family protein [Microbacterium xanthum]|uniref:ROK family protein n=1 Tax=Microbacterium xanthum TaxID=3079794 RepID=UPI002AD58114|nr:ROK family protein [Microbacterium sp. KSW-48]MDZ8171152.1 ROK family protein [Microbacterium sp. KSW-48]